MYNPIDPIDRTSYTSYNYNCFSLLAMAFHRLAFHRQSSEATPDLVLYRHVAPECAATRG